MIQPLSPEEIANLEGQGERVMEMLAALDRELYENGLELEEKERVFGQARIELEITKAKRSAIIERMRNLKTIAKMYS